MLAFKLLFTLFKSVMFFFVAIRGEYEWVLGLDPE